MESISVILQKANLSQYVAPLLEVGADDVEQLASLPEQDFQNLLDMIGMAKKFFHVLRFKKAINRTNHSNLVCQTSSINSATHTVTVYATQIEDSTVEPATLQVDPIQHNTSNTVLYKTSNSEPTGTGFVELMATPNSSLPTKRRSLMVTSQQLQNLVDDTVLVQKSLGPSPISPDIWDEGRKEILRRASQLFICSSSLSPLSEQEELMNEASYQLCLWDPTLLVRQKDLYLLSRKLIQHFLPTSSTMDIGHPKQAVVSDCNNIWTRIPPYSVNRGPDGKFRSCFEENYERRELQMQEIELLLAENNKKEKTKQAMLLQAKEKMDYSLALKIQEELSLLGKMQRELKSEMSRLRKVQRRSIRHQELKKSKKSAEQVASSHSSPPTNYVIPPTTSYSLQHLDDDDDDDTSTSNGMIFATTTSSEPLHQHGDMDMNNSTLIDSPPPIHLQTFINHNAVTITADHSHCNEHEVNPVTIATGSPNNEHKMFSKINPITIATDSLRSTSVNINPVLSPQNSIKVESSVL